VTIRQTAYNLVPGNFDGLLDTSPQNQTITIRSNFDWVVSDVSDSDDILLYENSLTGTEREANTGLGSSLAITLQPESSYVSKNGKTAVITVESRIDNSTWNIPITIVEPLYVGHFGGELKQHADGKYRFERALYIQGRDQGTCTWGPTNDDTPADSPWDGKGNTLALFQRSSTNYPAANACFTKNSNYASITGKTDSDYQWYLPAQMQLQAVWVSHNSFDAAHKLLYTYYRSTTESSTSAWLVIFTGNTGYTSTFNKTYAQRVRCVREVEVTP
jgi:hypothetical protein